MKEESNMTIEEKARAYDEALEVAKRNLEAIEECGEGTSFAYEGFRNTLIHIFPELKESEDERIRKELICYFEKYPSIVIGPFNTKECIAWLEKQSTPQVRTGLEWVNTIDDACDKRYSEEYAHGEYCHEQSFKWGFQEGVDWLEKQKGTEREIEGNYLCNGEQKPIEEVNGEDYGIDGLYAAMDILNKTLGQVEGYQSDDGILEHKAAMTAVKKLYKQKPVELEKEEKSRLMKKCVHRAYQQGYDTGFFMATTELEHKQEWSEEDESMRIKCIGIFETYCAEDASRLITWLKSIKDRVQPEQEWSEEDEERQEETIELLETLIDHPKFRNYATTRCVDWLKSLRPQKQWKPSEEQIKAVKEAACYSSVFSEKTIDNLISLSKQLKAL